jgi:hypothetical protein
VTKCQLHDVAQLLLGAQILQGNPTDPTTAMFSPTSWDQLLENFGIQHPHQQGREDASPESFGTVVGDPEKTWMELQQGPNMALLGNNLGWRMFG